MQVERTKPGQTLQGTAYLKRPACSKSHQYRKAIGQPHEEVACKASRTDATPYIHKLVGRIVGISATAKSGVDLVAVCHFDHVLAVAERHKRAV